MNNKNEVFQNDEIDLKELWKIVIKRKKVVFLVTTGVLLVGIVYAFVQRPIYEVKAIVEIGSYSTNTISALNTTFLESPQNLIKRLDVIYIDNKNVKDIGSLKKVDLVKGTQNLIEVIATANSNEDATQRLNLIVDEICSRHKSILESYIALIKIKMKNLEKQQEDIVLEKQALAEFIEQKMASIDKILKDNPAVAAVYTIDLNTKASQLTELKAKIYAINNQLSDLSITLSSNNVKPTVLIGDIIKNDYPIKPRKLLIIAVSFVSGFILSIFLVFLLEFIGKNDDA